MNPTHSSHASVTILTEFKPTLADWEEPFHKATRLASKGTYHLVGTPGKPTGGVAMLVSTHLAGNKLPKLVVHPKSRIIEIETRLLPGDGAPMVRILGVYGSRVPVERVLLQSVGALNPVGLRHGRQVWMYRRHRCIARCVKECVALDAATQTIWPHD